MTDTPYRGYPIVSASELAASVTIPKLITMVGMIDTDIDDLFTSVAGLGTSKQDADATLSAIVSTGIDVSMFATNVVDTDTSLTANSNTRIPSQAAIKAYVDAAVVGTSYSAGAGLTLTGSTFAADTGTSGHKLVYADGSNTWGGATTFANIVTINMNQPDFRWYEADGASNEKYWWEYINAGIYSFNMVNDAFSASTEVYSIDRSAHSSAVWTFASTTSVVFGSIATLSNNLSFGAKDSGGTRRILAYVDSSDYIRFGDNNNNVVHRGYTHSFSAGGVDDKITIGTSGLATFTAGISSTGSAGTWTASSWGTRFVMPAGGVVRWNTNSGYSWGIGNSGATLYFIKSTADDNSAASTYWMTVAGATNVVNFLATPTAGGNTIWHSGNDGAGSGLDADLLDGISSVYLIWGASNYGSNSHISNLNDQVGNTFGASHRTGFYTNSTATNKPSAFSDWTHWIYHAGYGWGAGAEYGWQMAHGFWTNDMYVRKVNNGTWSAWARMWNSDNDGAGSGLDADLLDGLQPDTGANASTIATRNGSGDLYASSYYAGNWFRSTGASGWYNQDYSGGIYMSDGTWVRVYGSKAFYVANEIAASGNVTAYYSDERFKTRESSIDGALEKIMSLDAFYYVENELARSFGYKNQNRQVGLSAQQVKLVMPEVVGLAPVDMEADGNGGYRSKSGENYMTLDYSKLVPLLVAAIQELNRRIDGMENN